MENLIKHSVSRFKSSTPPFFKKLSKILKSIAIITATSTTALYALPSDIVSSFPVGMMKYIGITVFFCTMFGYIIAELTTDDKSVSDEQYK